jgi:hypothetical protein
MPCSARLRGGLRLKAGFNSPVGSHPKRRSGSRLERPLDPLADAYDQTTAVDANMGPSHPRARGSSGNVRHEQSIRHALLEITDH